MTDNPVPPPPGYYDDGTGHQRYWDGQTWAETTVPEVAPVAPQASHIPAQQVGAQQGTTEAGAKKGLGTWALVLGIIGTVLAFIPRVSGFGIFLGVLALIFGIIGLARKGGRSLAGTILGGTALLFGIIFASVYGAGTSVSPAPAAAISDDSSTTAASPSETAAAPSPSKSAEPAGTAAELQALVAVKGYLSDGQGFSQAGLLGQLTSSYGNGFAQADAQWAIDHSGADWNAQAVTAAKGYLSDGQGFSQAGLLSQLTSSSGSQFTQDQAAYGVANSGADWNAQAVQCAKNYMSSGMGFSRDSLIQQMTSTYGSQFTEAQAEYAASQVGLN